MDDLKEQDEELRHKWILIISWRLHSHVIVNVQTKQHIIIEPYVIVTWGEGGGGYYLVSSVSVAEHE